MNKNSITTEKYLSMSDKDKAKNVSVLSKVFKERESTLSEVLESETKLMNLAHHQEPIVRRELTDLLTDEQIEEIKMRGDGNVYSGDRLVGMTIFGVKDTLEPIDIYIDKIKASPLYRYFIEQVASKIEDNGVRIETDRKFHDFMDKYRKLKEPEIESLLYDVEDTLSSDGPSI